MKIKAKPIVPDRFWILEKHGEKVGTLQAGQELVVMMSGERVGKCTTFEELEQLYNIDVENTKAPVAQEPKEDYDVHGYPCKIKPYNDMFDLKRKLPLYTKNEKSTSFFCAGYYVLRADDGNWRPAFCPKLITLTKNEYEGPYKTEFEMKEQLRLKS